MTEFSGERRINELTAFCRNILDGADLSKNWLKYRDAVNEATPADVMIIVDTFIKEDIPYTVLKPLLGKMMNAFYSPLKKFRAPEGNPFISELRSRNQRAAQELAALKPLIKEINNDHPAGVPAFFLSHLEKLQNILNHYIILQNILFPNVEKYMPDYRCVQVMWSIQDDVKRTIKDLVSLTGSAEFDLAEFNRLCGELFFTVNTLIFREEYVLIPAVSEAIPEKVWEEMDRDIREFEKSREQNDEDFKGDSYLPSSGNTSIDLGTGNLSRNQLIAVFDSLPVDLTLVDRDDRVVFFSDPPHRIFPRTASVIGRRVQNCHPPESVSIVEEILGCFRAGSKKSADFSIKLGNRFILIQYFALYDVEGYAGTLEVSQDITEIRTMEAEKRIPDWNG